MYLQMKDNEDIAPIADRILRIHDGRTAENFMNAQKPVKGPDI